MQPDQNPEVGDAPPSWRPQAPVPDFFAARAVVMPPEDGSPTGSPPPVQPSPSFGSPLPPPSTYGAPPPMYDATAPVPVPVPWGAASSPSRFTRKSLWSSALAAGAVAIAAVLVFTIGIGKNGSTLSNAEMIALVHNASSGLSRSPATTFQMTVTTSRLDQQQTINISGVTSNAKHDGSFTMTGPGISESFRAVDGVVYIELPATAVAMNGGKQWVGVRSTTPTVQEDQLESSGPAGMLQALSTVGGTVQDKGTQTIDGAQTTEYSVHVDVSKLLTAENPQLASMASGLGLTDIPMTIWIDRQGLPRKMTMDLSFDGATVNEVATMTPTSTVPHVVAPPASQVRLFNSLSDFEETVQRYVTAAQPSY